MSPAKEVERFNAKHPVGTLCRFWKGVREGDGKVSRTRSPAEVLSGHTAVVWFECGGGCIALSHVEPIPEPAPLAARPVGQ